MSIHQPLVSIVTPAYNQARFLRETINSVLSQDYRNIEYIVIDDGSTDETSSIMASYGDKITALRHSNIGQARTLNKGWNISSGKYIGYLSSDDILYPTAISQLVALLENHRNVVVAYPNCDLIDPYSKIIKKSVARKFDYDSLVIKQDCHIGPGALFRKALFDHIGGWRPELRLAPDREFWMRAGLLGDFSMINASLAGYRMHENSISYYDTDPRTASEYIHVLDNYFSRPDIPHHISEKKNEAYSYARLILCRMHLREGKFQEAFLDYKEATTLFPALPRIKTLSMLARTSVSKPMRNFAWQVRRLFSSGN